MPTINFSEQYFKIPDQPALIRTQDYHTWRGFHNRVVIIAGVLSGLGIRKGDRVALLSVIDYQFPEIFFALLKIGAIAVPVRPDQPSSVVQSMARAAGCRWLIPIKRKITLPSADAIEIIPDDLLQVPTNARQSENFIDGPLLLSPEQPATLIYTSGSRGKPRGVLHTLGNHYYSALGAAQKIHIEPLDKWLIALPFFHIAAIAILFRTMLAAATSVINETSLPLADQLKKNKISHVSLVPAQLQRLLDGKIPASGFPALRAILTGGSHCPQHLTEKAIKAGLPLYFSYGSTEMASQITTAGPQELKRKPSSSGRLLPHRRLKIAENNEILVGGKTLGTIVVIDEKRSESVTDQWYHTRDTGFLDKTGHLFITGRLDNMFISGGENIQPEEIENALLQLDRVVAVCVVAVPDQVFGEKPVAFIQIENDGIFDEKELRVRLEELLPRFKIPKKFFPWKPDTENLKPDRTFLRLQAIARLKNG